MKILIVRIGAMGDVLHALPAVAALRVAHPEATIDWLVDRRWMPLLAAEGNGPVVSRAIPVDIGSWKQSPLSGATLRDFLGFRGLRSSDYDLVLDMQGTLRSAGLGRLAALGAFAGFADPREALAARLYKLRVQRRGAHVVDQGAALLGDALRITLTPIAAALPRDREAESWGEEAEPSAGDAGPRRRVGRQAVAGRALRAARSAPARARL
jgi:heptosyltransferase-1